MTERYSYDYASRLVSAGVDALSSQAGRNASAGPAGAPSASGRNNKSKALFVCSIKSQTNLTLFVPSLLSLRLASGRRWRVSGLETATREQSVFQASEPLVNVIVHW